MKILRTISALLPAILVLISSTSFMVGAHFCMGEIQNVSFFGKADNCEKEQNLPPCHRHEKAPCCKDETVIHKGNDFKGPIAPQCAVVVIHVDIGQPSVLIAEIIPSAPLSRILYYNYDPPLRSHDLTIEQQVFLI